MSFVSFARNSTLFFAHPKFCVKGAEGAEGTEGAEGAESESETGSEGEDTEGGPWEGAWRALTRDVAWLSPPSLEALTSFAVVHQGPLAGGHLKLYLQARILSP